MEAKSVLIDATILIDHFRTRDKRMSAFRKVVRKCEVFMSVMTLYEVEFGAARAGRLSDLKDVLPFVKALPIDQRIAEEAARLHADLIAVGKDIGVKDAFIAASCMVNNMPILTRNVRHFKRIPDLRVISPSDLDG